MASISVRRLDEQLIEKLRLQAAAHGVSMEEEVRDILLRAVTAPNKISDVFIKYFGPKHGIELKQNLKTGHQPIEFDGHFD